MNLYKTVLLGTVVSLFGLGLVASNSKAEETPKKEEYNVEKVVKMAEISGDLKSDNNDVDVRGTVYLEKPVTGQKIINALQEIVYESNKVDTAYLNDFHNRKNGDGFILYEYKDVPLYHWVYMDGNLKMEGEPFRKVGIELDTTFTRREHAPPNELLMPFYEVIHTQEYAGIIIRFGEGLKDTEIMPNYVYDQVGVGSYVWNNAGGMGDANRKSRYFYFVEEIKGKLEKILNKEEVKSDSTKTK